MRGKRDVKKDMGRVTGHMIREWKQNTGATDMNAEDGQGVGEVEGEGNPNHVCENTERKLVTEYKIKYF